MEKKNFFAYSWHIDKKEDECTLIRIYGLDTKGRTICVSVQDFTPYVYVELPSNIRWDMAKAGILGKFIDQSMGKNSGPLSKSLQWKKKLYYANVNLKDEFDTKPKHKLFPYLLLTFRNTKHIRYLQNLCKKIFNINHLGQVQLKIHEHNASPILQLVCCRKISTAGWIQFAGKKSDLNETYCNKEYRVRYKNLFPMKNDIIPEPLVLSFDIEVYSSNPTRMPDALKPKDKIFQISCIFKRGEEEHESYLLTLGDPDDTTFDEDIEIWSYGSEAKLIEGFADIVIEKNPQVITGYNIFGFDIPYMIQRAKSNLVIDYFDKHGMLKDRHAEQKLIKWTSAAYKDQEFEFIDTEGRLYVDLLPIVKRDYKFDTYTLKNVSNHFLGETKDPLTPRDIFRCYELGMKGGEKGSKALGVVGKYCVKDSVLVAKLFDVLQVWVGLCEMAKTCNVPIFVLYTQGQQIKVFSQIYKECMYSNYVVEKIELTLKDNEQYTGATVFPPKPGLYDKVVPFDFSSLYPTTIIAYNIDYSTLVQDDSIPDSLCNIFDWEDHIGCEHDEEIRKTKPKTIICGKHYYRFLKYPKGIVPTLLENLLEARRNTKTKMKEIKGQIKETTDEKKIKELKTLVNVLDKRQLSFKVSCNSAYGAMGVKRGYLPFLPGAMCTTAGGRRSLEKAAKYIQENFTAELVYGDTDSCYIHFPGIKTAQECWDFCLKVEKQMVDEEIFPPPMKLAFEEKIYWRFFIITKKRYMALSCERDGVLDKDIYKRGVLLARRDNSKYIRETYGKVITDIFDRKTKEDIMYLIIQELNKLCSSTFGCDDFIITKSVGETTNYKIRELSEDGKKKQKRLKDLGMDGYGCDYNTCQKGVRGSKCRECIVYIERNLPAQVQLAERMKRRGKIVQAGSRIPFIITTTGGIDAKQFEKIEDPSYQQEHSSIIKIDYLYYNHLLINPLDQLIEVAFKEKDFVKSQYKLRVMKYKLCREIKNLFKLKIQLE